MTSGTQQPKKPVPFEQQKPLEHVPPKYACAVCKKEFTAWMLGAMVNQRKVYMQRFTAKIFCYPECFNQARRDGRLVL